MQQTVAGLDIGNARVERIYQFDQVLRRRRILAQHLGEARHLTGNVVEVLGLQRLLLFERVDAVVDVADAAFDRCHAVLERLARHRIFDPIGIVNLKLSELADGRRHVVQTPCQRLDVHFAALRHDLAEAGDLPLEPLDLAGLANGARQQFDHMRELRDLIGDVLDVCAGFDLRADFAFEAFEPPGQSGDRMGETLEQ